MHHSIKVVEKCHRVPLKFKDDVFGLLLMDVDDCAMVATSICIHRGKLVWR